MDAVNVLEEPSPRAPAEPGSAVIVAHRLTKAYGSAVAVHDLSFEVGWGRVTGFLGPNGAGKSTTLRMVLGLTSPTEGSVTVLGRPYGELEQPAQRVGALLDASQFHPLRSGRNHLRVLAAAAGVGDRRVDEVLDLVGLRDAAKKKAGEYSLGMRQRLGLGAALLGDPEILILDEPSNGLDPAGIKWLREFLRDFADRGNAVFVSSHLLAEVSQMADEVVVIDHGRLIVQTSVDDLTLGSARVVRVRTPELERFATVLKAQDIKTSITGPEELTVRDATAPQLGRLAAREGIVLYGLDSEIQSLEEIFFDLTSGKERVE